MGSYAGVYWAAEKHDVFVADAAGEKLLAATFAHDEQGLRSLCRQLVRLGVELVAVERPDGLLVERLLDAGLRVLALHPNGCYSGSVRPFGSGSVLSGRCGLVLGRRRADSLCHCRPVGLTGFRCVARRRPRTTGVT
jgi:hypothetical protein